MTAGLLRAPAPPRLSWRDRAACRNADPDLFFPGRGESADPARQICARCPVRQLCLVYALDKGITHGVWGGLAEQERRVLRAPRQRASRRERDRVIVAADAAGYTRQEIARAFGLSRTSVSRILLRAADVAGRR
jgi:WhiB family transcriptional regulator, redox-sensing transcriptional regulator